MKKFLTGVVMALVLTSMMGMTVFAAGSSTSEDVLKQQAQQLNQNVTQVSARTSDNRIPDVTRSVPTTAQVSEAKNVADQVAAGGSIMAMSDLSVAGGNSFPNGITITLYVDGIRAGDNVYVMHKTANAWEILKPSSVGNGYVTVKLYSLSPVVVVRYPAGTNVTVSNPSGGNTNTSTNNTNSNNTSGDTQTNNNSQNNNQNNNQNNPVNVEQNVTVNYPDNNDDGDYDEGYDDGYNDGRNDAQASGSGSSSGRSSAKSSGSYVKSPKTGESLPLLPAAGILVLAGLGFVVRIRK